jgi:hypothetical protein
VVALDASPTPKFRGIVLITVKDLNAAPDYYPIAEERESRSDHDSSRESDNFATAHFVPVADGGAIAPRAPSVAILSKTK